MKTAIALELFRSAATIALCYLAVGAVQSEHVAVEKVAELTAENAVLQDQTLTAKANELECHATLERASDVVQMMRDRLKACYAGEYK